MAYRVGLGHDSHRLIAGKPLILGGVTIPYELGLDGHSDADVLLHALTDALLGSVAAGDIGELFPNTDATWHGANSRVFVEKALDVVAAKGYRLANVDATVHAERPKLSPFKQAMGASIAQMLQVDASCISVKAKTGEGVGPVGRRESIAADVIVLVEKD